MQLELQGFLYGLLSTALSYKEDGTPFTVGPTTLETLLLYADSEFTDWPTDWLDPFLQEFLQLELSLEQMNALFLDLDSVFRDCVPTDLNTFTTYADGEVLTPEQWTRLYDAIAFIPPPSEKKRSSKTRHIHGRRSITPMRSRKAMTVKKQRYSFVKLQ